VLRRPVREGVAPSAAAKGRISLYTKAMQTLGSFHPALTEARRGAVVIPIEASWPARHSRPWHSAPPLEEAPLQTSAYWRVVRSRAEALNAAPRRRLTL
jgi:hypothetical protein